MPRDVYRTTIAQRTRLILSFTLNRLQPTPAEETAATER